MCGIAGIFGSGAGRDGGAVEAVRRMTDAMAHRGPDGDGIHTSADAVLGHRRLSLVDLSPAGHQPMRAGGHGAHIAFNGEIYNFYLLRDELERAGCHFASGTDTEVILHGYLVWGLDRLLARLRGMFAFALLDSREGRERLYIVRDRLGIKPLYYSVQGGRVAFASEVRALAGSGAVPSDAEPSAALSFLLFGSLPGAMTTLRAVRALEPGHYLAVEGESVRSVRFYDRDAVFLERPSARDGRGREEAAAMLRPLLEEVVQQHLISDAPLGVFLSGGIDSSALAMLAARWKPDVQTVSIVFDEADHSEEPYQRLVLERLSGAHHRVVVSGDDFRDGLDGYFAAMDQPTVDGVNTYFVARAARRAGMKAVLSGVGGDEVFAGYATLPRATRVHAAFRLPQPARAALATAGSFHPVVGKLGYLRGRGALPPYLAQRGLFTPRDAARLLGAEEREAWEVIRAAEPSRAVVAVPRVAQQFMEMRHYLTDQLLRDSDVFGMAHSVEIRVPLLDHPLVEAVLGTPPEWSMDPRWPKPLLSRPLRDLLPEGVIFRRKHGFAFPIGKWMSSAGEPDTAASAPLDPRAYAKLWSEFRRGQVHWSRVWAPLILSRFMSH